jgi:hypothetical protein
MGRHANVLARDAYLPDDVAGQVRHVDAVVFTGEGDDEAWTQGRVRLDEGRAEKKGRHDRQAARQRQSVLAGTRSRICHSMSGDSTAGAGAAAAAETIDRLLAGSISMDRALPLAALMIDQRGPWPRYEHDTYETHWPESFSGTRTGGIQFAVTKFLATGSQVF